MKKLILAFSCLSLIACEKVIDYEIPFDPPKITVDARIIEGDSVRVFTGLSSYSMDKEGPKTDSNFEVTLYENDVFIEKLKPSLGGYYYEYFDWFSSDRKPYYYFKSVYKPKAGNTYKVEVKKDGYPTIHGSQLLREKVQINSIDYDTSNNRLTATFNDPPGRGDYYQVIVVGTYAGSGTGGNIRNALYMSTSDPSIDFFYEYNDDFGGNTDGRKYGNIAFLSDEFFDGISKELDFSLEDYGFDGIYYLQVSRISEDLYRHERSKAGQWLSDGIFSEPTPIFSNVENGYGIVGSMASDTAVFKN